MNVYLFGFSKRKNSTKQPVLTDGTLVSVQLKEETTTTNPTLILNLKNSQGQPIQPTVYNYVYIPLYLRYYFIVDWQYMNGVWAAFCNVDVLASFKTAIGNTSAYIERSSYASNGNVIDILYPATADVVISSPTVSHNWRGVAPSGGAYILGVINNNQSYHIGAVTYYAMDTAGLNSLFSYLFGNNIYQAGSITEIGEDLFKSLFNPFQYIVSCMWLPGYPTSYGSVTENVKVGYWTTNVTAYVVSSITEARYVTAEVPAHPQASRGNYLNYAPYTRITLYCPPFGSIPIDPYYTREGRYLYARTFVDVATGEAVLNVSFRANTSAVWNNKVCVTKTARMGVPIQIAQVLSDYSGSVSSIVNGVKSTSKENPTGFLMGLLGGVVESAIATQMPQVSTSGSNGSFNTFIDEPALVVEHYKIADEDNADLGRPLMAVRTLSNIPGFIKCAEAHFAGVCYENEREKIDEYLMSGFFYE